MKAWRLEWLVFADCWGWVVTLGIASVEKICWGWDHWESRVGCVSSWGRNLMAREPSWEQNGLPPMVNIMQVASAKSQSARGASY